MYAQYVLHSYNKERMSSLTLKSIVAENQRSRSSKREPYRFLPRLEVTYLLRVNYSLVWPAETLPYIRNYGNNRSVNSDRACVSH